MGDPKRIYLQHPDDAGDEGRTWCEDRIDDDDTKYVRGDLAQAEIERLEKDHENEFNELEDLREFVGSVAGMLGLELSNNCGEADIKAEIGRLIEEKDRWRARAWTNRYAGAGVFTTTSPIVAVEKYICLNCKTIDPEIEEFSCAECAESERQVVKRTMMVFPNESEGS